MSGRRSYTSEERREALDAYRETGSPTQAAEATGINANTIRSWARRGHVSPPRWPDDESTAPALVVRADGRDDQGRISTRDLAVELGRRGALAREQARAATLGRVAARLELMADEALDVIEEVALRGRYSRGGYSRLQAAEWLLEQVIGRSSERPALNLATYLGTIRQAVLDAVRTELGDDAAQRVAAKIVENVAAARKSGSLPGDSEGAA